jgi:glycosyltransferase involved in cell wall biosynthesis
MRFSIITPSLNQGPFLRDCLESVQKQVIEGMGDLEHLVVDGGSVDGTVPVLESWKAQAEGGNPTGYFFDFVSEPDRGQAEAINKGLRRAQGDIWAYLCADDFYEAGALKRVATVFAQHPEVDVVYGDFYFLEGKSGWKRMKKAGSYSWGRLERHNFLGQPAVFWRRAVAERFGFFDEGLRYCMDHEYWLRLGAETKWFYLEEVLATARLHGGAKTSRELVSAWWETAEMAKRYQRGFRFWGKAVVMQIVGQWIYRWKRGFFEWWGSHFCR